MPYTGRYNGFNGLLFSVDWMIFWTISGTLVASLLSLVVYIYYLKNGQFEDEEETKYQLFHEDEES